MYPLMTLYRMRRFYRPLHIGYAGGEGRNAYKELQDAAQRLVEHSPELFQIVTEGRYNEVSLVCDEQVELPGLPELAAELHADAVAHDAGRSLAQMELLATVLAKGDMYSYYGNSFDWSNKGALHLFTCGIDWSLFKDVTAQRWSNFAGTFTEHQDESDVMEAQVTCRCDEAADEHELRWGNGGIKFGMSLPSIATVIVKLDSGVLFEIMDER